MQLTNDLDELGSKALQLGASATKIVDVKNIKTGRWTHMKCQYGCPNYGSNLCCPPYTPDFAATAKFLSEYDKGMIVEYILPINDISTDFEKIDLSLSNNLLEILLELEKAAFLQNHYRAFALKAGRCRLCEKCNLQKCVYPLKARPSLEACGIDVFALANDNGFNMQVLKGPVTELKIYGLLLVD